MERAKRQRRARSKERSRPARDESLAPDSIPAVRARLGRVLNRHLGLKRSIADEAAFHLTDWAQDLIRFAAALDNRAEGSDQELADALLALVVHAPAHMAAAQELVMGAPFVNPFRPPPSRVRKRSARQ